MITRKTPSKGTSMIKIYLDKQVFEELFKDNPNYIITKHYQSDGSDVLFITKNVENKNEKC